MNPLQILRMLLAHWVAAIVVFVVVIAIGAAVIYNMPKQFDTTTSLVFDVKSPDPVAGLLMPLSPGFIATQTEIIKSDRVAQRVVRMLRLDENAALKRQWTEAVQGKSSVALNVWIAELLQKGLQVSPERQSTIINLTYRGADPAFVTLVANAFAQVYIDTNIELRADPARQAARWFGEQGKLMRENLEKAQSALSAFQQEKGLVAKDEQLDTETSKLREMSAQLTTIQAQNSEARSKQQTSRSDTLPEVMNSPLLVGLRNEINRQEARLQEIAGNLGKNHPQYQRMETEIRALKKQLDDETRHVTSSLSTSRSVGKDRESELLAAIDAQKKKLLKLRTERDQLAVLQRDVDAAQGAYDGVSKRYNQTSLESQITQTNVSVLNPAVEPIKPSSPNIPKLAAAATLLALFLGAGVALLMELIDRRIRAVDDLAEMLQLPVLAVVERPRKPSRLLAWRRRPLLALK